MNKRVGLVLGSGGARGLAHIGVLKVLIEEDIKIDFVAGSSAGAFIGAYFCINGEINGLEKIYRQMKRHDFLKLVDPAPLKYSLLKGKKLERFISGVLGDVDFKDLKIPLSVVATDLERGETKIFEEGSVLDAVMASVSIPGVLPPREINGKYYVDGGLVDPTPVDILKDKVDAIIAVDLTMKSHYSMIKKPSLFKTLIRSFEITRTRITDLSIKKEASNYVLLQPHEYELGDSYRYYNNKYIEEGEQEAIKHLNEIRRIIL